MNSERETGLDRFNDLNITKKNRLFLVYKPLIKAITFCLGKYAKGQLLDIGCGNKPYLSLVPKTVTEYKGCDIIQSSSNCVDILCEAHKIPVADESFDIVFSTQTIEHVGNFKGMLSEAYRSLRTGGYFIVSGPMYWPLHEEPYDFHRFTKHGFKYELENVGFKLVEIIPNGGKWALLGQVIFLTLPNWFFKPKLVKIGLNTLFYYLDNKYPDYSSTTNYVAVGQKPMK